MRSKKPEPLFGIPGGFPQLAPYSPWQPGTTYTEWFVLTDNGIMHCRCLSDVYEKVKDWPTPTPQSVLDHASKRGKRKRIPSELPSWF